MFFKSKAVKNKIDKSTEQILELEAGKKRLEIEMEQIRLDLANQKKREDMKLEVEAHKHHLKLQEEKAVFDREKRVWEIEKKELQDRAARDKKEFEDRLKADSDLKMQEAITLMKLESQQKVKQTELDKDRSLNQLETVHSTELSKVKSDLAEEYYRKLTSAFQDIQMNGDKNSKFVQELALKVFDRVPTTRSEVGVEVSNVPQLVQAKEA